MLISHEPINESKMVNVNSPLPFNLHNIDMSGEFVNFSRSASASTLSFAAHSHLRTRPTLHITPLYPTARPNLRSHSTSQSQSQSRSRSSSSTPHDNDDSEDENEESVPLNQTTILGLRLVKGWRISGAVPNGSRQRGRAKAKAEVGDEPDPRPDPHPSTPSTPQAPNPEPEPEPSPVIRQPSISDASDFWIRDTGVLCASWGE